MTVTVDIDKELLCEALEIANAQRKRASMKFKPGTPAHAQLMSDAANMELALNKLRTEPTPIEDAINNKRK